MYGYPNPTVPNMPYNPMANMGYNQMGNSNQFIPKTEVVKVTGYNGANAFPMGANSSALLLDDSNPIVWLVQTDGACYKTITPYSISPYQEPKDANIVSIEERIQKLEDIIYAKSDSASIEQ